MTFGEQDLAAVRCREIPALGSPDSRPGGGWIDAEQSSPRFVSLPGHGSFPGSSPRVRSVHRILAKSRVPGTSLGPARNLHPLERMLTDLTFVALAMVATPSSLTTAPAALARESRPTEGIRGMHLETSDGLTLSGTYYEPNSKRKMKAPAAILIHTAGAERESLDDLARYLQRKGVGVLTFDLRGHRRTIVSVPGWTSVCVHNKGQASRIAKAWRRLSKRPIAHSHANP